MKCVYITPLGLLVHHKFCHDLVQNELKKDTRDRERFCDIIFLLTVSHGSCVIFTFGILSTFLLNKHVNICTQNTTHELGLSDEMGYPELQVHAIPQKTHIVGKLILQTAHPNKHNSTYKYNGSFERHTYSVPVCERLIYKS